MVIELGASLRPQKLVVVARYWHKYRYSYNPIWFQAHAWLEVEL